MRRWPGVRGLARSTAVGETPAVDTARVVSAAITERDGPGGLNAFLAHDPALLAARAEALDA
ncbi:MAG: hypothetical protein ACOC3J_07900, partial [Gemmatimonadota bacterium]